MGVIRCRLNNASSGLRRSLGVSLCCSIILEHCAWSGNGKPSPMVFCCSIRRSAHAKRCSTQRPVGYVLEVWRPQCRLRPVSVPVGRRGDPSRQTSAQWLAVACQWFSWNGEPRRFHVVMRSSARPVALRMGRATLRPGWVRSVEPEALKLTDLQT